VHTTGFALLLSVALSAATPAAEEHLLAGATAFREERFDVALVEFRVAQQLGAPDAATYAATALVKLNRVEEVVESFGPAVFPGKDALIDYYRAVACYEARLFLCADRLMAAVGERAGPRIAGLAASVRASIATALAGEPTRDTIDWYMSRCVAERSAKRTVLGDAYCREAAGLAQRRSDGYRRAEAEAGHASKEKSVGGASPR
jgi:hypothetical protein